MSETTVPGAAAEPGLDQAQMTTRAFVARTVSRVQAGYVRRPQDPRARAALAQLRRGLGRDVGEVPEILELTVNPGAPRPWGDEPTPDERAIHVAVTLYALHQQSQQKPMHVSGVGFGEALGRLRYAGGSENAGVVRRFQALGTATDLGELVHHARSLVPLLRGAGQGFDYGAFAEDLTAYQDPRRVDRVRLRWGRDFYRVAPPAENHQPSSATTEENR